MGHFYVRMAGMGALVLLLILFGMNLASRGIEQIHGKMDGPSAAAGARQVATVHGQSGAVARDAAGRPLAGERRLVGEQPTAAVQMQPYARPAGPPLPYADPTRAGAYEPPSTVERFAGKTGELLQITASHGIRFVVTFFDQLLK